MLTILLVTGCAGGNGGSPDSYQFSQPLNPDLILNEQQDPRDPQQEFDISHLFGGVALDHEIPVLTVDRNLVLAVVESTDDTTVIEYTLPEPGHLFLRFSDNNFPEHSCPIGGTVSDTGIANLEVLDSFTHPIRRIITAPRNFATLDVTDPPLTSGGRYYTQGCLMDSATGLFTGDSTNTVVIEIASALPDLIVSEVKPLGRSATTLGRLFVRVADLNAALVREIRSDTFNYRIIINDGSGTRIDESTGTANLQANGSAWIIPGSETPGDSTDDIRLPDDGRSYEIRVDINNAATAVTLPEANHSNNSSTLMLRARPKPLIFGIDSVTVNDNCDAISPGDWLMILQLDYIKNGRNRRYIYQSNGTSDVEDDSTVDVRLGFKLEGTNTTSNVTASLSFLDCDLDVVSGFLIPGAGIGLGIGTTITSCGGEEAYEVGGQNDFTGWAGATLGGVTAASHVTRTAIAAGEDCGAQPFSAEFKLMTQDQATAQGFISERIRNVP